MQHRKKLLFIAAIAVLIQSPFAIKAQQPAPAVVAVRTARPLAQLLPDKLAGVAATGDIKQYSPDNLAELVAGKGVIYQEYSVERAASRQYGRARIDLFETQTALSAFGLLSYVSGAGAGKALAEAVDSGEAQTDGARIDGALVFRKDNYFVRVSDGNLRLARALVEIINSKEPAIRPRLLNDLPQQSIIAGTERYFLGPESLNTFVERGREMFGFTGDAEAVMAEYDARAQGRGDAATGSVPATARQRESAPAMKIVIIEYKTPHFAHDAAERATGYVNSLPENEQGRIIVKREGNFLIEAVNFHDRETAQALVDSVKYPYGVKWLHDPRRPPRDPFRMQKAAQMLVSTFGLLGALLATVLVVGAVFGTTIFLKRRKQQEELFSDAGGMLRLELDPFEATILGLPPKRD